MLKTAGAGDVGFHISIMSYLNQLYYKDTRSSEPTSLPTWANFYGELGSAIVRSHTDGSRSVVALDVPARSFCSPLIAAGAITQMAASFTSIDSTDLQHFETLKALPKGTPIRRTWTTSAGGKKYKTGITDGYEEIKGRPHLRMKISKGSAKTGAIFELLSPKLCRDVKEDLTDSPKLPIAPTSRKISDG